MLQKDVFLKGEGDCYLKRNKTVYANEDKKDINPLYRTFNDYFKEGWRVLEIGCCNGLNLNYYVEKKAIEAYGVDPSSEAIEMGKVQYPKLHLSVGTADSLDFEDDYFDVVIFGFCMYLIDRKLLMKSLYEADRVLKDKGLLCITDFDSPKPYKRKYKHFEGVYSYKYDYSKIFCALPDYTLIEKYANRPSELERNFYKQQDERVASWVLYKDVEQAYFEKDEEGK